MKKLTEFTAFALALCLAFAAVGCTVKDEPKSAPAPTAAPAAAPTAAPVPPAPAPEPTPCRTPEPPPASYSDILPAITPPARSDSSGTDITLVPSAPATGSDMCAGVPLAVSGQ